MTARCGTNSGYQGHIARQERTCAACRRAHAVATADRNAARTSAYTRLGREFPERFRELYVEELRLRGISPGKGVA